MAPLWMDKDMLQQWLEPHYGHLTITDINAEAAVGKGDNQLSSMKRLHLTTLEGKKLSFVVKCKLQEGASADSLQETDFFKNEQEMFSHILPQLDAMLKKASPHNYEPLAPKCIYACEDFIMQEDLAAAGFSMGSRLEGLDLEHCLVAMRCLARYHAASTVLYQQNSQSYNGLGYHFYTDPSMKRMLLNFFGGITRTLLEELKSWPQEWSKYIDMLKPLEMTFLDRVLNMIDSNNWDIKCLAHGDVWVNNLLFSHDGSTVQMVDFQACFLTSPVIDIHYFLATSPKVDVMMNHTETLLKEYHSVLCETLEALQWPHKLITLQELQQEMDSKSLYGLYSVVVAAPGMTCHPDCGHDMNLLFDKGLTVGPKMFSQKYKKTVQYMFPRLEKTGAFKT